VADTHDLKIPVHIGFIMDGNRRWAKERNLPTLEGHRAGLYDALVPLLDACMDRGVKYVTVYAFSTENWDRSKEEINYLIGLMEDVFTKKIVEMEKKGVRINVIGRMTDYPEKTQKLAQTAMERTKGNDKVVFNIALSYGGRDEIVTATRNIVKDGLKPSEITEEKFKEYIFEAGQPDPDIIVRTSGEYRLSGFMLWQSAYAELYFTNTYWPDFNEVELDKVIAEYNHRERRFGK
jgi:undecaprenyl diphosphate synthase